jgi:hypothetical protein
MLDDQPVLVRPVGGCPMNGPSLVPVPVIRSQTVVPRMTDAVNPRRRCSSARRRVQAEQTRKRVLDAAAALFEQRGFEGASRRARGQRAAPSPEDEAVECVWAIASPELHQLLVRGRGWTRPRYSRWLADTLAALLLSPERRA